MGIGLERRLNAKGRRGRKGTFEISVGGCAGVGVGDRVYWGSGMELIGCTEVGVSVCIHWGREWAGE